MTQVLLLLSSPAFCLRLTLPQAQISQVGLEEVSTEGEHASAHHSRCAQTTGRRVPAFLCLLDSQGANWEPSKCLEELGRSKHLCTFKQSDSELLLETMACRLGIWPEWRMEISVFPESVWTKSLPYC